MKTLCQSGEIEAFIKNSESPKKYAQLSIDMIQGVKAVPPHAVEVTMALTQLELRHLEKIAPCLWEERNFLLKIPLRKISRVEAYLNKPPLQAKERNCIVKGSN
jgi:hypothetical protein